MRIQNFRRLSRGDFEGAPSWTEAFFRALNEQIIQLVSLAQGNITLEDNLFSEVRTIPAQNDVTVPIRLQRLRNPPLGVLVLGTTNFFDLAHSRVAWEQTEDAGVVNVNVRFDTDPPADAEVTLLIVGS